MSLVYYDCLFFLASIAVASGLLHAPLLPSFSDPPAVRLLHATRIRTALCNTVGNVIDINAPRDTSSLREWASYFGCQTADGFQFGKSKKSTGVDVFAVTGQNIPQGSPILYVPNELIVTGSKAKQELGEMAYGAEQVLMNAEETSDRLPQFYLFLKILREYELGEESMYYAWLNSLPRFFSNGASMTDFCFGCLPPYAAGVSLTEKKSLQRFGEALQQVPFLSDGVKNNPDLTTWAFSVVHTRYFTMPNNGDLCIAPMADYFNHGGLTANVDISYDESGNCYAYSSQDIPAGQPLQICYGDPTNPSNLLARYGFLDESSPATYCKYVVSHPSQELVNIGYDPSRMLFYNNGGISQEVWDVLLFQELKQVSLEDQQALYAAHMNGDEATKQQYHEMYFPKTLAALKGHVEYLLDELDELSIGVKTQLDQGLDASRHPRLGLILRHNEFVKETFEIVRQNLDSMMYA